MERYTGVISRGVRGPIIREGDDIVQIVTDSVLLASNGGSEIRDRDIVAVTESVVARAQGNYATCAQIAKDVKAKFPSGEFAVIFPILSRNRFAICLKAFAMGAKKIYLMLSYPSDEVGNHLISMDEVDAAGVDPYADVLSEEEYRKHFGFKLHQFTGVDYIEYYKELIKAQGAEVEVIFANDCRKVLPYTKNVLCCDIHTRARSKRLLKAAGAEIVYGMDEILTESVDGCGFNPQYGLLGTNKATEDSVKLFPHNGQPVVEGMAAKLHAATGKNVEVMIYGDGAFKDPVGKIWELADPVVSPAYTPGLIGQPNEVKIKFLADNDFAHLSGDDLKKAIEERVKSKESNLVGQMVSEGTTPRQLTDLIGSLCDLTSGSGDKGTPIIWISGYFDNMTVE